MDRFDPEVNPILECVKTNTDIQASFYYALEHAVDFYNRKKFFEAHEILEFQWKKEKGDRKLFIQALIQISVAMNKLYVKINIQGALSQASLALEKLLLLESKRCFNESCNSHIAYLIENLRNLIEMLKSEPADYSSFAPPVLIPMPIHFLF